MTDAKTDAKQGQNAGRRQSSYFPVILSEIQKRNVRLPIRLLLSVLAAVGISVIVAGCGGGSAKPLSGGTTTGGTGGNTSGGTTGAGGSASGAITTAQRLVALEAVRTKFASLSGQARDAVNQQMLAYAKGRSEFEAAGIGADACVWARFRDGRPLVIVNNRDPESASSKQARFMKAGLTGAQPTLARRSSAAKRATRNTVADVQISPSTQVRLLTGMGTGYAGARQARIEMGGWLQNAGYTDVSGDGAMSVEALRNIHGDAFLYMDTHGGGYTRPDGSDVFALWTSTSVMSDTEQKYLASHELDAQAASAAPPALIYMIAQSDTDASGRPVIEARYGITAQFVAGNIGMASSGLVYMNACFGASGDASISAFTQAFYTNGAALYAGWSGSVSSEAAYRTAAFLVDRLTGANQSPPVQQPRQRPFDWPSALDDLKAQGLDTDPSGARFTLLSSPAATARTTPAFGLLSPTIYRLSIDDLYVRPADYRNQKLVIEGSFGADPGSQRAQITVGGKAVTYTLWDQTRIFCTLPRVSDGGYGDVVVSIDGRKSNAATLTAWQAAFTDIYTEQQSAMTITTIYSVVFRADARDARALPDQPPSPVALTPLPDFSGTNARVAPDSNASLNSSGAGSYLDASCIHTVTPNALGPILYIGAAPVPANSFYSAGAALDFTQGQPRLLLSIKGSVAITVLDESTCAAPASLIKNLRFPVPQLFTTQDNAAAGQFVIPLNSDLSIPAGSRDADVPGILAPDAVTTAHHHFSWEAVAPLSPPDPAAARSARRKNAAGRK